MERYDHRSINHTTWLLVAGALVFVAASFFAAQTVSAAQNFDEPPTLGSPDAPITIVEYGEFM